jgi:hypothetical protein
MQLLAKNSRRAVINTISIPRPEGTHGSLKSMVDIFKDLEKEEPVLDGYLALTDDIIHVILNMPVCIIGMCRARLDL